MSQKAVRVLLVEDDERHAGVIRRAFESGAAPANLTTVRTLKEARTCLAQPPPDLVIADLSLPDGEGTELLPAGKEPLRFPVVVLTDRGGEQAAVEAVGAGAQDYVIKSEATLADIPRIARRALRDWEHVTERERAEGALRESQEMLTGILSSITDHMSMIDEHHNIVWCNEVATRLFGPDLVGKKCYAAYHRRDRVCQACVVARTFADGEIHGHDTDAIRADGTTMWFSCVAGVAARHEDGRPKHVVEVSRDITRRKRAEEALRQERKLLKQLLDLQERDRKLVSYEIESELIDETLPEAHASLAYVHLLYDWDWPAAEERYRRALELDPDYAEARRWYAEYLSYMGRHDESIAEAEHAKRLDPLSLGISHNLGLMLYDARQYDQAIEEYTKAIELKPEDGYSYARRGWTYVKLNDAEKASADFSKTGELLKEDGRPAYIAAGGYAYLSRVNEACDMLRKALERDHSLLDEVQSDSDFDSVRGTAEFLELMAEFEGAGSGISSKRRRDGEV